MTSHINVLYLPVLLPQALYKLYSVAANHRQLYNHAFPGHQTGQPPEQDKKQNWPHTVSCRRTVDSNSGAYSQREKEARDCSMLYCYNRNISPQSPTTATSCTNSSGPQSDGEENQRKRVSKDSVWLCHLRLQSKITVLVLTSESPFYHLLTVNTVSLSDTHMKGVCSYFVMDVVCSVQCYL